MDAGRVAPSETPLHLQQLQRIAAALQADKQQSDSVTWVPELIPVFVERAVQAAVAVQDSAEGQAAAHDPAARADGVQPTAAGTSSDDDAAAADTQQPPPQVVVAVGSQLFKHASGSSSSSTRSADWLVTTCLVPDGLRTAGDALGGGGLATLKVVCRVLILQNCQPCDAPPALVKALSKVKWQAYGLAFKEYFSCDDGTGILTLGVLPEAVMVPLSLVVCCCTPIPVTTGLAATADEDTAAASQPASSAAAAGTHVTGDTAVAAGSQQVDTRRAKRRRTAGSRPPAAPAPLSMRRSVLLWVGALQDALGDLKSRLPQGYLRARVEAIVAASLGPIATSLANIIARAANAELRQQCCSLLQCETAEVQERLLLQLQRAAAATLAGTNRAADAAQASQQSQQQQTPTQKPQPASEQQVPTGAQQTQDDGGEAQQPQDWRAVAGGAEQSVSQLDDQPCSRLGVGAAPSSSAGAADTAVWGVCDDVLDNAAQHQQRCARDGHGTHLRQGGAFVTAWGALPASAPSALAPVGMRQQQQQQQQWQHASHPRAVTIAGVVASERGSVRRISGSAAADLF